MAASPVCGIPCVGCSRALWPPLVSLKYCRHHVHERCFEGMRAQQSECPRCNVTITEGFQNPALEASIAKLNDLARPLMGRRLSPSFEPELLHEAIKKGDRGVVELLLDQGLSVSALVNGTPPLYRALQYRQLEVAFLLVRRGAPILQQGTCFQPNLDGMLLEAVKRGEVAVVEAFLDQGFSASHCENGVSMLYIACGHGQLEIASLLLKRGACVTARNEFGSKYRFSPNDYRMVQHATPMKAASMGGNVQLLNLLIRYGAPLDEPDSLGRTPICTAAIWRREEAVLFFIESGAWVRLRDPEHGSLLAIAVRSQLLRVVRVLVEKGVNVAECDRDGLTRLHDAARRESAELLAVLLEQRGVKRLIDVRFLEKWTPLGVAVVFGRIENVRLLVSAGADLSLRYGRHKRTILESAQKFLKRSEHEAEGERLLHDRREIVKFLKEVSQLNRDLTLSKKVRLRGEF